MKLVNIMRETGVARPGMKVREAFGICLQDGVPGIPYVDAHGAIAGSFSIRQTLRRACIPEIMVDYADLIGDAEGCLQIPEEHARHVLELDIGPFIQPRKAEITPESAVAKAVALMERHRTNYLFVTAGDSYLGIVTIWDIARRMLDIV